MNLKLDDDLVDRITVQNLIDALILNREMSEELMEKESLENFEAIDLADQLKLIKNIEAVLAYYMTAEDYENRVGKKFPTT